jgi:hypothetical protein
MPARAISALCLLSAGAARGAVEGGLTDRLAHLDFNPAYPPAHTMTIGVGVYFEHLFEINAGKHTFVADFWLVYRWQDPRNFSALFLDNPDVETEVTECSHADASSSSSGSRRRLAETSESSATSEGARRFLELGHIGLGLLWHPDLHVRNAPTAPKLNAELIRLYEDGTIEQLSFMVGEMALDHPLYDAYPFDRQKLTIQIESLAHTTKQILLEPIDQFSGLEMALTLEWPGWSPIDDGVHYEVENVPPDYTHAPGNEGRCERRARYHIDVVVQRQIDDIVKNSFIPLFLQVMLTWSAFYINVKVLMPRVAVAFISYLTLSNAASVLASTLPKVSYQMWLNVFILSQRLMVMVGLLETACCCFVTAGYSTRVGMALDAFARVFVPIDYVIYMALLFGIGSMDASDHAAYADALLGLEVFAWVHFFLVLLVGALFCVWKLRKLELEMKIDPMKVYRSAISTPFDANETTMMFNALDDDGSGIIDFDALAEGILGKASGGVLKEQLPTILPDVRERLKGKVRPRLDIATFANTSKTVMLELCLVCSEYLDASGQLVKKPEKSEKRPSFAEIVKTVSTKCVTVKASETTKPNAV